MPNEKNTVEEDILALLAGSNRWRHFVGLDVDAESIDRFIVEGDLTGAIDLLMFLGRPFLPLSRHLATIAIQCRQTHLRAINVIAGAEALTEVYYTKELEMLVELLRKVDDDYEREDFSRQKARLLHGLANSLDTAIAKLLRLQSLQAAGMLD